ncbi:alpha/beta hydrolase domain-containing protein 17B isoform X2 [Punica granatum]|uniref:Alpha/beta hydrolase domain-containing protein 17B isoform X2 n=1 Tax=Punica granatum TaxID=22663 RepID=A0A6P8D874_PUNGR|nr:alpha/beta hydrolase domain-containing protein 17B isoform X2 [Punica granatum]
MGCMLSQLAAKFAFFPPSPATYRIKKGDDGGLTAVTSSSPETPIPSADDSSLDVLSIDTKRGNRIVAFYLRNPYARLTVLYSHGNATDLGQLYDLFVQLKLNLRVNVMGYDYSGYGASTGKPSESNTYADIEAVYQCLETEYGVGQEDVILYGQSVGSGPTLHLASKLPRLRGVVLHSAILSGLRVLCHVKFTFCCDIYKNINKIRKVKCPVLVIHGTEDDVVNWLHGHGLWKMSREPYEPLWIKGGGHCNLELYPDYIRHLCRFIHEMEKVNTENRLKKIRQNLHLCRKASTSTTVSTSCCCCRIKLRRPRCPKCPECSMPSCPNCFRWPKCSGCCGLNCIKFKCCPECSKPSCPNCFRWPKCSGCCGLNCIKFKCCPECSMPSCPNCFRWPKCSGSCGLNCIKFKCCCWKLKCPRFFRPSCSCKRSCLRPKCCFCCLCCPEGNGKTNRKQEEPK